MQFIAALLAFLVQAQPLPPPFPRDGATKLIENDRVIVWDAAWLRQAYPMHRHVYDYAGVYYTSGDRIVVSERGTRSPTSTVAWDTFFSGAASRTAKKAPAPSRFVRCSWS